jgi:hypothetical protein
MLPVSRELETAGVLPSGNRGFLRLRTCLGGLLGALAVG